MTHWPEEYHNTGIHAQATTETQWIRPLIHTHPFNFPATIPSLRPYPSPIRNLFSTALQRENRKYTGARMRSLTCFQFLDKVIVLWKPVRFLLFFCKERNLHEKIFEPYSIFCQIVCSSMRSTLHNFSHWSFFSLPVALPILNWLMNPRTLYRLMWVYVTAFHLFFFCFFSLSTSMRHFIVFSVTREYQGVYRGWEWGIPLVLVR